MNLTDLSVTRLIAAPADKVFDVWMDLTSPGSPWHGAARIVMNPVVDGLFYFAVNHAGKSWPHYGRFLQIDRPRLAEYTWVSEATQGCESIVTVIFDSDGDRTQVILRHSGVPDDEMGRQHQEGWAWVLNALAARFGQSD